MIANNISRSGRACSVHAEYPVDCWIGRRANDLSRLLVIEVRRWDTALERVPFSTESVSKRHSKMTVLSFKCSQKRPYVIQSRLIAVPVAFCTEVAEPLLTPMLKLHGAREIEGRLGMMSVLAVESDPTQAAAIRHVVCDLVKSELTLVDTIEQALDTLHAATPDLILLPALVSPAKEADLLAALRTLSNGAFVETLITPVFADGEKPAAPPKWHRRNGRRRTKSPVDATVPQAFAERLSWTLARAHEQQQSRLSEASSSTNQIELPNQNQTELPNQDQVAPAPARDPLAEAENRICLAVAELFPLSGLPREDAIHRSDLDRPSHPTDLLLPDPGAGHSGDHERGTLELTSQSRHERSRHVQVAGPFDGWRRGVIDTPIVISNLSESGCFVNCFYAVQCGSQLTLGIHLPDQDWITVKAEAVHNSPGFGYAVRFLELSDATRAHLARLVTSRENSGD